MSQNYIPNGYTNFDAIMWGSDDFKKVHTLLPTGVFKWVTNAHLSTATEDLIWNVNGTIDASVNCLNAASYGLSSSNTAAQNNTAWAAILAAVPTNGAIIQIPVSATAYDFSATIQPTQPVWIRGAIAGINNAGDHQSPVLRWTGGASPAIVLTGTAVTNSVLEGFGLNNSGTGTVGIEIEASGVKLRDIGIVAPTVPFSVAGIRVGDTTNVVAARFEHVTVRAAAPIGLELARVNAYFAGYNCRVLLNSTVNVSIGRAATVGARDIQFFGGSFEQDTNLDSVLIVRGENVHFWGSYFESGGTGYAVNIPATTTLARRIGIHGCWFTPLTDVSVINVNFAPASVSLADNLFNNGGNTAAFLSNAARNTIWMVGNLSIANVALADSYTGVTSFGNQQGSISGSEVSTVDSRTTFAKGLDVTAASTTANAPAFAATATWASGAVAFTGMSLNITDTASATTSALLALEVAATRKFAVDKSGSVAFAQTPLAGSAPVLATSGASITSVGTVQRVSNTAAVTSAAVATGLYPGQFLTIINNGTNSVTFAASTTSLVASGTAVTVAATSALMLVWDSANALWYAVP